MMGYANPSQTTLGLQTRLFSRGTRFGAGAMPARAGPGPNRCPSSHCVRPTHPSAAFVFVDTQTGDRVVYVNADLAFVTQMIKIYVVRQLEQRYGGLYNNRNVVLASTHTHG